MVTMIRSDLDFILAQIKIAEADAAGKDLIADGILPNSEVPWGLRRVDGSNNNLTPGQEGYGAAGELFPRTDPAVRPNDADGDSLLFGPPGTPAIPGTTLLTNTNYGVIAANDPSITRGIQLGDVVDADPRIISNLIVDQTANNPAAIFKALQDAGLSNSAAFALLDEFASAVQAIKTARAEAKEATAAVAAAQDVVQDAQEALDTAIENADPAFASTLLAYQNASNTAAQLSAAVQAVQLAADQLALELTVGAAADPADTASLTAAQAAVANLLTLANSIVTTLQSDSNVLQADVLAAEALVAQIVDELSGAFGTDQIVGFINPANGVSNPEDVVADSIASDSVPATAALASTLVAKISATLASPALTDPDIVAAQSALDVAEDKLEIAVETAAAESAAATAAADALSDLFVENGITVEEAPGASPDILKATLYIGNVAADEGLSAPFNGWMTLFGQFFDHGLDLVAKGGFGTVYIPLQPDDPLYVPGSATNFMALTRATVNAAGESTNLVTPFVDQNQTYTSNASHQFFLREYVLVDGKPQATGRLLDGNGASGAGLATWADVKAQAKNILGIELNDQDIHHVPEILVDPYGNFIPDPVTGFPQLVRSIDANGVVTGVAVGSVATAVKTADGFVSTGVAFLDDIAHTANPGAGETADADVATAEVRDEDGNLITPANDAIGLKNAAGVTVSNTGSYDNELLDAHYITGDGRGNENIGLTAVHHVFHSEHNRQVDLIQNLLLTEAKDAYVEWLGNPTAELKAILDEKRAFLNEWTDVDITEAHLATLNLATRQFTEVVATPEGPQTVTVDVNWNGERIFQAAKLPTEMQYQHLVFEEFARKVQPAVNLFNDYDGTLDPAILAEFAHTVYRFGHSMLTETVDRFDADWNSLGTGGLTGEQIGLIEAFLNPLEFAASGIDAEEAAGVIAQGMTRQRGSEIDEFVTEALRNNLVGLPLDLAALNIARGRETGVPTLNEARADFFEGSGDTQVKPYESWFEFMQNLKNPASVINFIAAYGTHTALTATDVNTIEEKRAIASALVLGGSATINAGTADERIFVADTQDRLDFLNSAGAYATDTKLGGLNNVDFWIGGLAEKKLIFGGMLGSTFNFVFEAQLEALQNGDRFYYLSRLANLNLTAQLENNKFSEMIHRNTSATHLPGDAFARPDFFLEADISKQFNTDLGKSIDPTNQDVEVDPFIVGAAGGGTAGLVIRSNVVDGIAGKLEYTGAEHVVLGGTDGNDHLVGGKGDDTLWGDAGDDRLEGGDGNDFIFGGDGNDIITDLFGVDEIRSNAGDDVVSAGRGIKLIITDTGNDWVWGGVDDDEVLAGQGDDFVNGGDGQDFIIGGEGNDWLESGTENGLMLGDNGDLVQGLPIKRSVDSRIPGNDVLVATGGNADFDAETGDDIMVGGLGTDRFFGQFGFDWATYKNDPFGLEADMNNRLFAPPSLPASPGAILDRYAQTEALSGSAKTDILRGDDITDLAGGGDAGAVVDGLDHALYDFNVNLINGLSSWLDGIDETQGTPGVRFSAGNILMGGSSSDIIEGRGGNDLIDGDSWLNVRIARLDANGIQVESHDTMAGYQARVLAGEIKVAELKIVREILDTSDELDLSKPRDIDVAEFSGLLTDYEIEGYNRLTGVATDVDDNGFISVSHLTFDATGAVVPGVFGTDGVDQLKNIERLLFADGTIKINVHDNRIAEGRVTVTGAVDGTAAVGAVLTASMTGVTDRDGITGPVEFFWQVETAPGTGLFTNITTIVADELAPVKGSTYTITAAEVGLVVRAVARFKDAKGALETVFSNADEGGNPNEAATGAPTINDLTPTEGQALTANTSAIQDLDGLGPFSFQWQASNNNGATWTNIPALLGGTGSTFSPTQLQVGQILRVNVSFTDGGGFVETLSSAATGVVGDNFTGIPFLNNTFNGTSGDDIATGVSPIIIGGADTLNGNGGNDILSGAGGNDTLNGGAGNDTLNGDGGTDVAVFAGALANFAIGSAGTNIVVTDVTAAEGTDTLASIETLRISGTNYAVVSGTAANNANINGINGAAGSQAVFGLAGNDSLNGGAANDLLIGGQGDDTIRGDAGSDTIYWSAGDGRDLVNGDTAADNIAATIDTFKVLGDTSAETYHIYTALEAGLAGITGLNTNTEIVITRNGTVIAELNNIEEIVISGMGGGDQFIPVGNFGATSLLTSTITLNGTTGDDTVDISGLTSAHRIVFRSNGGNDTIIGTLRPQDVIELPAGSNPADFARTFDAVTGMSTLSNGEQNVSFVGNFDPAVTVEHTGTGSSTNFAFTANDIAELKKLVAGQPSNIAEDGASGIRDLEGTGNNVANPGYGAADEAFIRLTDARYGAGNSVNPIHDGLDARTISNILGTQEAGLEKAANGANIFFMAFGQYVDHGLDFLPKDDARPKITIGSGTDNPADLTRGAISGYDADGTPLYTNKTSPYVDQNQAYGSTEMVGQLLRVSDGHGGVGSYLLKGGTDPSNPAFDLLPTLREALLHHWNAETVFHDTGKAGDGKTLKQMYAGLIDSSGNFDPAILDSVNKNFMGSGYQLVGDANSFANILDHYVAGDLRANENVTLTSIHTVWARNHNYHVDSLLASGFDGTAEELFQAAKIVNEAEYQRVVFNEYADYLLGGLKGGGNHGHDEYNPEANAQISHEFAAAAFRFGHSQIAQTINVLDEDGNPKSVPLFDAFLSPTNDASAFGGTAALAQLAQYGYVPQAGYEQLGVSNIIGGIVRQPAEEVDFNIVDAVRNDLVRIRADLFAFNVARGWDLGVGTLNQVRAGLLASTDKYVSEAVELSDANLSPYTSWEDFQARNQLSDAVIAQFKQAYPDLVLDTQAKIDAFQTANPDITLVGGNTVKGIDRVDLWVGGLAEKHINDGVVGSTFWVILHEQFDRLQEADRFYYLDRVGDSEFYEALKELEFSDIVERNTGLTNLPEDIFSATDDASDDDQTETEEDDDDDDDDTQSGTDDSGSGTDEPETETEDEDEDEDEDDDTTVGDDDEDDTTTGTPPNGSGSGTGVGSGTGSGTGTSNSPFVVYLGAAIASDTAMGAATGDILSGGDGDDNLFGFASDDHLLGGDGDDYLDGADGNDVLRGNAGADTIKAGAGNDEIDGGSGDDLIDGGAGNDDVIGGAGRDVIKTGSGNDTIYAFDNDGNDVIDAGDEAGDSDTLDMSAISGNITVYLSAGGTGTAKIAGGDADTIKGIENFKGGGGNDVIVSSTDVNVLEGGAGADTFVFGNVNSGSQPDVITDLNFAEGDRIDLTPLFSSLSLGSPAFTDAAFSPTGNVRLVVDQDDTLVQVNTDSDADVDFAIRILGRTDLEQKDFV